MDYFLELYGSLPRGGPGDNVYTRSAYQMMTQLGPEPRILDIGCGPGMQTIELLKLSQGTVVALDILPRMISRVRQAAESEGVSDRLETVLGDMRDMPFAPSSFDVVWSEGAIYFIGFEKGLDELRRFVKPRGYVAVSEAVWIAADPPREAVEFWREYPEIDTVDRKLQIIAQLGYEPVGHFVLPASGWTESYYEPLLRRIAACEGAWKGVPDAEDVLQEARTEIAMFGKYSRFYSYAFFVMRN